jgi:hypothetical protein
MWGKVTNRDEWLKQAIEFTGNALLYGEYMVKVLSEMPNSCEHNLSNITQNRKAWIGHAACALAIACPEDIVREAWSHLSAEQQDAANYQAELAIKKWELENE